MRVFDASVVVDAFVIDHDLGEAARDQIDRQRTLFAPTILRAEVLSALRSLTLRGVIPETRGLRAIDRLRRLSVVGFPIEPLMGRIWELRSTISVYDAWYVALAERLSTTLVTTDRRLAGANGPRCEIELIEA
ncbi:MAG: type II toxin-antitoxin system VapC family toxin [Actinomycetota bacterium]|nr:type II toxin-antitoxin system VapC family toxin [Actinomycetota bacterium]